MQPTSWQLIRTNQWPRMDLDLDASGLYGLLERTEIETSTRKLLPHTCDLFEEARFFIQLFASLEQCDSNLAAANWCVGAHFGAYISIDGAASYDIENLGHKYYGTGLQKEFYLTSNASIAGGVSTSTAIRCGRGSRVP
jgi:hypothetical protein